MTALSSAAPTPEPWNPAYAYRTYNCCGPESLAPTQQPGIIKHSVTH